MAALAEFEVAAAAGVVSGFGFGAAAVAWITAAVIVVAAVVVAGEASFASAGAEGLFAVALEAGAVEQSD